MGKIIEVPFSEILPGEGGIDSHCMANLIIFVDRHKIILPPPVRLLKGKYLHLDGKHRILYQKVQGKEAIFLYHTEDPEDIMTSEMFLGTSQLYLQENNYNILRRWNSAEQLFNTLKIKDYNEYFKKLKRMNNFLKNEKSLRKELSESVFYD